MSDSRYEPLSLFNQLQQEINRLFEGQAAKTESSGATAEWIPAVDIDEYEDRFVLYADLPGVDPGGIELTLERGVLTISGQRERVVDQGNPQHRRRERADGRFYRRFTLPDTADSEKVKAAGRNGVLEIVIPKQPEAHPRRITVEG